MLKSVYPALAVLALLFVAMAGVWNVAPSAACASEHVTSHDGTSIDDDERDDDDALESGMLAPPGADEDDDRDDADADGDGDGDGNALHRIAGAAEFPPRGAAESLSMTRWGLRPSGEHRAAADRPPRV